MVNYKIKCHSNNQNGVDLLYDGYILPKLRENPSGSISNECRNGINLPCPASITIFKGEFDHNRMSNMLHSRLHGSGS